MTSRITIFLAPTLEPSFFQFVASSFPVFVLLCYFLHLAHVRQFESCYTDLNLSSDEILTICRLVPLKDLSLTNLILTLYWTVVAVYLSVYVPKRHALIEQYISKGTVILGDVIFESDRRKCWKGTNHDGMVVYPHPHFDRLPVFVRRQVRIFERYTRERTTLLYLENLPYSVQPKVDLEMDLAIVQNNKLRITSIRRFCWGWVAFCYISLVCLLKAVYDMDKVAIYEWQPDYNGKKIVVLYEIIACLAVPLTAYVLVSIAWSYHRWWMTSQHETLDNAQRPERNVKLLSSAV
jgi:hypothetical protein